MADDENVLCPICNNDRIYHCEFLIQPFIAFIGMNINVEPICNPCIDAIFFMHFHNRNMISDEDFNLLLNSNGIIEKLTNFCNESLDLLFSALLYEQLDVAEILVKECIVNINAILRSNYTKINDIIIMNIVKHQHMENDEITSKTNAIKFLLKHGADAKFKDDSGNTYDYYLTDNERIELHEYLLLNVSIKHARK
jgi:hypothetical protein